MKKYGKKYAPWLLFLFVAACLLTSTAAALPDSGAAASVPQAELEQALEEAIFRRRDGTPADVSQYNLTEEQLAPVTAGVLADNYADALVTVSYDSAGANSVSAMDVEMDSTLSMALDELDQINENSPEPMGGPELQTVYAHYAELQAYYESEPEYFGLPCPYFTSKDTETSPDRRHSRRGPVPPGGHRRRGQPDHPSRWTRSFWALPTPSGAMWLSTATPSSQPGTGPCPTWTAI